MKNQLNTEYFENLWLASDHPSQPDANFWNRRAEKYNESSSKNESLTNREKKTQEFLDKGIIGATSRVLDIGCGSGQLAISLAKVVKEVVAMDFSSKMLAYAKENAQKSAVQNIRFSLADWEKITFEKSFDFVLASMSPAISTPAHLYKMMNVCEGYCYLSAFVERSSFLRERMYALTDQIYKHQFDKINYIFNILWTKGILPELSYEKGTHNRLLTLENAKQNYPFELSVNNDPIKIELIHAFLIREEKEGFIKEIVNQIKGELIWKCS